MKRRHKPTARNTRDSKSKSTDGKSPAGGPLRLPNIAELIEYGEITLGVIGPVACVTAVAHDRHNTLAMLVRRDRETLAELLTRLDLAIAKAQTEDVFTDEINPPSANSKRR